MDAAVRARLSRGLWTAGRADWEEEEEGFGRLVQSLSQPPALTTLRVNTLKYSVETAFALVASLLKEVSYKLSVRSFVFLYT